MSWEDILKIDTSKMTPIRDGVSIGEAKEMVQNLANEKGKTHYLIRMVGGRLLYFTDESLAEQTGYGRKLDRGNNVLRFKPRKTLRKAEQEPTLLVEWMKDRLNFQLKMLEQSERDFSRSSPPDMFQTTKRIKHDGKSIELMLFVQPYNKLMIGRVSMSRRLPYSAAFQITKDEDSDWRFGWLNSSDNKTISEDLQRKLLGVIGKMNVFEI